MNRFIVLFSVFLLCSFCLAGPAPAQVQQAWVARTSDGGPASQDETAQAITVDSSGNV